MAWPSVEEKIRPLERQDDERCAALAAEWRWCSVRWPLRLVAYHFRARSQVCSCDSNPALRVRFQDRGLTQSGQRTGFEGSAQPLLRGRMAIRVAAPGEESLRRLARGSGPPAAPAAAVALQALDHGDGQAPAARSAVGDQGRESPATYAVGRATGRERGATGRGGEAASSLDRIRSSMAQDSQR